MIDQYDCWVNQMQYYQNTAQKMSENYYNLLIDLLKNKRNILNKRKVKKWELYYHLILSKFLLILLRLKNL